MAEKLQAVLGVKVGSSTAAVNALAAKIKAGLAPLERFQKAGKNLQRSFEPITGFAVAAAGAIAGAAVSAAGLGVGIKNAFDVGGDLKDLSNRTGASVDELAVLQQAFKNNGMAADQVGPSINKLQKALQGFNDDGDPTNDIMVRLGLNMRELAAQSPSQQLQQVGAAINKLDSPTERAAAAMAIFGKKGGEMLALFDDPAAIGDAANQIGSQAALLKKDAALFDNLSDTLNSAGVKLQGFFVGMADQIAPVIAPLVEMFGKTDFASIGQKIGAAISMAVQAVTDGSIWGIMGDSAIVAITGAINFLWKGLNATISAAGEMLVQGVRNMIMYFGILANPSFWVGMATALMGMAAKFGAFLLDKIADVIESLRSIPGMSSVIGSRAAEGLRKMAADARAPADAATSNGVDLLTPIAQQIADRAAGAAEAIGGKFTETFNGTKDALSAGTAQSDLDSKVSALADRMAKNNERAYKDADAASKKKRPGGDGGALAEKNSAQSFITASIGGFGLFQKNILARDPVLLENQKQTNILQRIEKNTAAKPMQFMPTGLETFGLAH